MNQTSLLSGIIHGWWITVKVRDPRTDWSKSIRDFQKFDGPGSVRSGPRFWNFSGSCPVLEPGPTGFGPWIPGQSLLEDQVSNLSLSLSLTQSSEETDLQEKQVNDEKADDENVDGENADGENADGENADNENVTEKADLSGEENLDEALMSILENFSDDDQGSP